MLVNQVGVLVVNVVLLVGHLQRLVHVLLGIGKAQRRGQHAGAIDVAVRALWELLDETLQEADVFQRVQSRCTHEQGYLSLFYVVGQGFLDACSLHGWRIHAQSAHLQLTGKQRTNSVALLGLGVGGGLQNTYCLALFVQYRATRLQLVRLHVDGVVGVVFLEHLSFADSSLLAYRHFLGGIWQQPCRGTFLGLRLGNGQCLRLLNVYHEFGHVIHVVGSNDAVHRPLLALSVDDDGTLGTLERHVAADGLAIVIDEESVRTAYQLIVGVKCLQREYRINRFFSPSRILCC